MTPDEQIEQWGIDHNIHHLSDAMLELQKILRDNDYDLPIADEDDFKVKLDNQVSDFIYKTVDELLERYPILTLFHHTKRNKLIINIMDELEVVIKNLPLEDK